MRTSNIRDFRVDQTSQEASQPGQIKTPQQFPKQNVQSRQNLVTEWTAPTESIDSLWESWTVEQNQETTPQARPKTTVSNAVDLARAATHENTSSKTKAAASPSLPVHQEEGFTTQNYSQDLPWATQLASEEKRLEKAGAVDLSNAFGRQEILKIRTREFAQNLQKNFREQIDLFNESRKSAAHSIHVYKVAGAPDDFMLFRNGLKLIVSAQRSGKIQFAFNQYIGQLHAPTHQSVLEIDAAWGAFDQLIWTYRAERVQISDIVRYFLTEFSRQSFR